MTTRKDLARDALYSAIADILSAYHLPTEDKCEDAVADYIDACLDALPVLLTPFNLDPDEDQHGNRW